MQRSQPSKSKTIDELKSKNDTSLQPEQLDISIRHEVRYHNKPWHYAFRSTKEIANNLDVVEIQSFATECFRLLTKGHAVKTRAVIDKQNATAGVITEKVPNGVPLKQLLLSLHYLYSGDVFLTNPSDLHFHHLPSEYPENPYYGMMQFIEQWQQRMLQKMHSMVHVFMPLESETFSLDPLFRALSRFLMTLKTTALHVLQETAEGYKKVLGCNTLNQAMSVGDPNFLIAQAIAREISRVIEQCYRETLKTPLAVLIEVFAKRLEEAGLPEVLAASYVLGAEQQAFYDIQLDEAWRHIYKTNPYCFAGFRLQNEVTETTEITHDYRAQAALRQSFSARDIDEFPNPYTLMGRFSRTPDFFNDNGPAALNQQQMLQRLIKQMSTMQQRAFNVFLLFVSTPLHVFQQLSDLFVKNENGRIVNHLFARIEACGHALKHSSAFIAFIKNDPAVEARFLSALAAQNQPNVEKLYIPVESPHSSLKFK